MEDKGGIYLCQPLRYIYPDGSNVLMEILSVVVVVLHQYWWDEILSIIVGKDKRCTPEFYSFTRISPLYPVPHEELIGAYHISPDSIRIKYDLFTIPNF